MERQRAPMSPEILMSITRRQDRFVRKTIENAQAMATDTKSTARRAAQRCKSCFYNGPFLAGQAFTDQPCMCCGEVQSYSSTATDVLCMACAKAHELCKKCGADIDLRLDRTDWPAEPALPEPDPDAGR